MRRKTEAITCDWCGLEGRFAEQYPGPGWAILQAVPLDGSGLDSYDLCPAHADAVVSLIVGKHPEPAA